MLCSGETWCETRDKIDDYLTGKTFRFPAIQKVFDPEPEQGASTMITGVKEGIIYPYLPDYSVVMNVELNKGIVIRDLDVTGISAMLGSSDMDLFINIGGHEKNYFPRNNSTIPISLRLQVGEKAFMYKTTTYMLTNWLIDIGGISKALYFGGLVISHFVALRAYKAALIGDVFMV